MGKGTCAVDDCERVVMARGVCGGHYQWLRAHGTMPTHGLREQRATKMTREEKLAASRAWKARNKARVTEYMAQWHRDHSSGRPTGRPETHGMSQSREFRSWEHAKSRVSNPNHHAWADYGGRGITMAPEWLASFEAFYAYMGPRPVGTSLDRIDPDGNYEPGNVRWADAKTQGSNRRNVRKT